MLKRAMIFTSKLLSFGLFDTIRKHARGDVLDVGGRTFYSEFRARYPDIRYASWTTIDPDATILPPPEATPEYRLVHGDGCNMDFADNSFDTVLNIQVLEHVFDGLAMVREVSRVLKPGGHAIFLIPQTAPAHGIPDAFFCNFSRYWVRKAMAAAGLNIIEERAQGGVWRSLAYRHFYFFLNAFKVPEYYDPENRRNILFYAFFPFMAAYSAVSIAICLIFSLGDLKEEPNNHLVLVRKNPGDGGCGQ